MNLHLYVAFTGREQCHQTYRLHTHMFFESLTMLETSDRNPFSNLDVWRQNENSDSGSARFLHSGTPAIACKERPRETSLGENISHHYLLASTNNAPTANRLWPFLSVFKPRHVANGCHRNMERVNLPSTLGTHFNSKAWRCDRTRQFLEKTCVSKVSRRVVYRTRVFNVCGVRHWFHTTNHSGFACLSKFNFLKKVRAYFYWICKKAQRHSLFFCAKCSSQFLQWACRGFCGNCFPISTAKREHASKSCHWARLT